MRAMLKLVTVFSAGIALLLLVAFFLTRPTPPNFDDPIQWTLIKAGRVRPSASEITVYLYNREPGRWDSRDILQNRIVVNDSGKQYVYIWPTNDDYAAGWCELLPLNDGSIGIALFERDAVVRMVRYAGGQFHFRLGKDELIAANKLRYEDVTGDGRPDFVDYGRNVWLWSVASGFELVRQQAANSFLGDLPSTRPPP